MHPAYRIIANGADMAAVLASRLKSVSVTDAAGFEADTLEIQLADHDPAAPVEMPPTGAEVEVWLGYGADLQRMGLFVADEIEVEGPPGAMTIRGRAAPYEGSKLGKTDMQTQKTRAWPKGTKLGAMVAKIAKEHGLDPAVAQSLKDTTLPHFDQTDESDVSFLVRVTRKYDGVVKPGGGKLAVAKRGESKTASGADLPTITVRPTNGTRWSMNVSTRDSEGTVVAFYHDRGAAKRQSVQVGSGDPVRRLRHNSPDRDSALRAANAELDKRGRRKNKLSMTMPGDARLTAEAKLQLEGFRPGIPTDWVVSRVVHRYDAGTGYTCDVEAEKPNGDE
jgi:phage protein D